MEGSEPNPSDPSHPLLHWSAGIYDAKLSWVNGRFDVAGISAVTGPNPAGIRVDTPKQPTDDDVLAAVAVSFASCARDNAQSPSNCPQKASCSSDGNAPITWTIRNNPVDPARAQVLFDTETNSYQVTGTYEMAYTTSASGGCLYSGVSGATVSGLWLANVVWDGSKLIVVDIVALRGGSSSNS